MIYNYNMITISVEIVALEYESSDLSENNYIISTSWYVVVFPSTWGIFLAQVLLSECLLQQCWLLFWTESDLYPNCLKVVYLLYIRLVEVQLYFFTGHGFWSCVWNLGLEWSFSPDLKGNLGIFLYIGLSFIVLSNQSGWL